MNILQELSHIITKFFRDVFVITDEITESTLKMTSSDWINIIYPYYSKENSIISIYDYKNPFVHTAIREIKYHKNKILLQQICLASKDFLEEEFSEILTLKGGDRFVFVPIPATKNRIRNIGYNQSELISKTLGEIMGIETNLKILKRIKENKKQHLLTKTKRKENIKNSFLVNLNNLNKESDIVVIIDDVTTSGETFREIKRIFEREGVKKILCLALAH